MRLTPAVAVDEIVESRPRDAFAVQRWRIDKSDANGANGAGGAVAACSD